MEKLESLDRLLSDRRIKTLGIAGHVRPDGDCIGSTTAVYQYAKKYYPEIQTDLYLEPVSPVFSYIRALQEAKTQAPERTYDLFLTCDVSTRDRIGIAQDCFSRAAYTVCIDHHISNPGFAQVNHVRGEIGSCCEVLFPLMDPEKIDRDIAISLFTGMVHDTGVFQYRNTTPDTLRIAAALMEKNFDFTKLIEESFYEKTYVQNQALGRMLMESTLDSDGRIICGCVDREMMKFYGLGPADLEGFVQQLRLTKGVEAAIFLYELEEQTFKVSLRSNSLINVNTTALVFGGGGHEMAAGCIIPGSREEVFHMLTEELKKQLP